MGGFEPTTLIFEGDDDIRLTTAGQNGRRVHPSPLSVNSRVGIRTEEDQHKTFYLIRMSYMKQ